jgi:ABC-type multidrug transport system fused ATPase/permease subunit
MLARFWQLLTLRERLGAALLLLAMLLGALLETVGIGMVLPFLALLAAPETAIAGPILSRLAGWIDVSSPQAAVTAVAFLLFALLLVKNAYLIALTWAQFHFLHGRQVRMASSLLRSYLAQPYEFFLDRNSSLLVRRLNLDIFHAFTMVVVPLSSIVVEGLVAICILLLLLVSAPGATLVTLSVFGVIGVALYIVTGRILGRLGRRSREAGDLMIQSSTQALRGIKEAKILGREDYFARVFAGRANEYSKAVGTAHALANTPRMIIETLTVAAILIVALLPTDSALGGALPTLGLFALAAVRLMPCANRIVYATSTARTGAAHFDSIYDDLSRPRPVRPRHATDSASLSPFREISLSEITYAYPGADRLSLNSVTIRIRRGQRIALVGHSGAGKTTLADILLGLLHPTSGEIRVDGVVVPTLASRHLSMGYVPQSVYLLDDTVRRNVAFGIPDNDISEDTVWESLRAARLEEFVSSLPGRLESRVGENGVRFSGGQRQRLGIARALYGQPSLLVLDEATSALDGLTENEIRASVDSLSGDQTVIVIAHRISTVKTCDLLFFLKDGRLVAADGFETLMRESGEFRSFAAAGAN